MDESTRQVREQPWGPHCPVGLPEAYSDLPYIHVMWLRWEEEDAAHYERGERINGFSECPSCELWWPRIEEPDMWEEIEDGYWVVSGWWGAAVCEECNLLMVEQPDGTPECYRLPT